MSCLLHLLESRLKIEGSVVLNACSSNELIEVGVSAELQASPKSRLGPAVVEQVVQAEDKARAGTGAGVATPAIENKAKPELQQARNHCKVHMHNRFESFPSAHEAFAIHFCLQQPESALQLKGYYIDYEAADRPVCKQSSHD
jgi:hypothetical protein